MVARKISRYVLLACGWLSLLFGVAGMFVPVLPTAPFVLLAAACFMRSSEPMHRWVVEHPRFGPHVADYLAGRGLRRRAKAAAISTLWASVAISVTRFVPLLVADVVIVAVAALVTAYILRLPTASPHDLPEAE